MTITAPSGAAPHSSGCICAGPDHSLARERAASGCLHIAPTSVAIVCAKSIWARAAEGTQKTLPSRRARQPVERLLSGTSRPSRLAHTRPGAAADPFLEVAITGAGRRLEQGGFSRAPQYATPFAPRPQRRGLSLPSHLTRF